MAKREVVEFQCSPSNCRYWNYPKMDLSVNGRHKIVCGNCGHVHHRVVKDGKITEDRWNNGIGDGETYIVMPSACSKEKRIPRNEGIAAIRQREHAGSKRDDKERVSTLQKAFAMLKGSKNANSQPGA